MLRSFGPSPFEHGLAAIPGLARRDSQHVCLADRLSNFLQESSGTEIDLAFDLRKR
jgi:hypothetical protein